ncbi:TPA: phosphohydrolase [Vibrio vulnificus]|nr:phosphohydrolase [Vibrio vulnificus]
MLNNTHHLDDAVIIPSVLKSAQLDMFGEELIALRSADPNVYFDAPDIDLDQYDKVLVMCSMGKDSIACFLRLLELGVPKERIELWHHLVDGSPSEDVFMDWAFMDSYFEQFANAYGVEYYRSYLNGGFKGEMLKNNTKPHGHTIETPSGILSLDRPRAKAGTRMRFPQQAASLTTRWCSSELKIVVGRRGITSQPRFEGCDKRILYVVGERREESNNRATYNQLEPLAGVDTMRNSKNPVKPRYVDVWRPVLHMDEAEIWDILRRHNVIAPVPYRLGWGRSSCMMCIFNSDKIFATIAQYWPEKIDEIATWEDTFGVTIARSGLNVKQRAAMATPFHIEDKAALAQSFKREYELPIFTEKSGDWKLPSGAFCGEVSGAS